MDYNIKNYLYDILVPFSFPFHVSERKESDLITALQGRSKSTYTIGSTTVLAFEHQRESGAFPAEVMWSANKRNLYPPHCRAVSLPPVSATRIAMVRLTAFYL